MANRSWIERHINDPFVQQAQKDGYPSRAAYKLLALQEAYRIIRPGMVVLDLGAAPGGWSAVAAKLVGRNGRIYAVDLLPVQELDNVTVIEGDCYDQAVADDLAAREPDGFHLIMSDMAPNFTGHRSVDQPRSMALVEMAATLAGEQLRPGGTFLAKVFQGEGLDEFRMVLKKQYKRVMMRKPAASRAKSREFYILAQDFLGYNNES